ncbi:hypothetical protein [Vulgatibacter incomptus]|nr:hypothetical protein [Vulgatibacter incomptus]
MPTKLLVVTASLLAVPALAAAAGEEGSNGSMQQQPGMSNPSGRTATSPKAAGAENAEVFKNKSNFKVDGTIASIDASSGELTLQRTGMPPAELKIANDTKIRVNGKSASIQDLQPGSEVRAEFNLAENRPIAVSVDAKEGKGQMKGGTAPGGKSQGGTQGGTHGGGSSY